MASHDISHCNGDKCKKRETCHRFLQYRMVKIEKYPYPISILLAKECIKTEHSEYWSKKNADKSS